MCSLVEILPKVGHVRTRETLDLGKREGVLFHVSSSIIYDRLNDSTDNEGDVFQSSLVYNTL